MTEIVRGHFQPTRPDLRQYPSNAPFVSGALLYGDEIEEIDLLIDTGADHTVISPQNAFNLLGVEMYREIFQRNPTLWVSGIGAGSAVQLEVQLFLSDSEGGFASFDHTVIVMGLAVDDSGSPLNWSMPSLLGRDIQEYFLLTISHRPPIIELEYVDDL